MYDLIELHRKALGIFERTLEKVRKEHMTRSTPCSEWDVRALLNHVIGWNLRVPHFLAGKTLTEIPVSNDVIGDDPGSVFTRSAEESQRAWEQPGSQEKLVRHPAGDVPGELFLYFRLSDNYIHGWDLATAIGVTFEFDDDLTTICSRKAEELNELMVTSGLFAAPPDMDDEDANSKMLAAHGRKAPVLRR